MLPEDNRRAGLHDKEHPFRPTLVATGPSDGVNCATSRAAERYHAWYHREPDASSCGLYDQH